MKLFKTHFSVIFSLFTLLCSFQFIIYINQIIYNYEVYLADDYSIIVVSNEALDTDALLEQKPIIKSVTELDTSEVLSRLKNEVSLSNIELLQKSMPKFYTLKLDKFPSINVSNSLKKDLLKIGSITKVEIFAKTYNKIYYVLKLMNFIVFVFVVFAAIASLLLILKQTQIWTYEHQERIFVMNLFGASFWTKSAVLYKSAIVDSFVAVILTIAIFVLADKIVFVQNVFEELGISAPEFILHKNGAVLLAIALVVSIFSTTVAMSKVRRV
ncbi:MAG: ABC transporter permease [Campylobacteraceae bacterium]|jgi:cell division transport system permease protein|nr:ABC transporter permease [Campylobacteraceae bacterium]